MQNWEVVKKRISEMSKDEFIGFARTPFRIKSYAELCDTKYECSKMSCETKICSECLRDLLEAEYQSSKQEKWIVHRTLRTKNKEIYIGTKNTEFTQYWLHVFKENVSITYEKESAFKYDFYNAVTLRDELNKTRRGKQYLWVISKVEE